MLRKIIPVIIILLFAGFGCSKPAQDKAAEGSSQETEPVIQTESGVPQGVLVLDGSLQEQREDGRMYWKAAIYAGDTVGWTGEQADAVLDYNNQTRTFWRVDAGGDYWIQQYFIAGPARPAVIINDDTVLYTKPDPSAVARSGKVTLSKYTIVAMLEDDNPADDFIRIAAPLGGVKPDERWVKIKDISWDTNDVGGVKLTRAAAVTKNAAAHKELLKNAMELLENGKMLSGVPYSIEYDPGIFELTVTNNLEVFDNPRYFDAREASVNVRDLPSFTGNVVRKLDQNESVLIVAASKETEKTKVGEEEISGVWLETDDGNWVFSYYLARELQ